MDISNLRKRYNMGYKENRERRYSENFETKWEGIKYTILLVLFSATIGGILYTSSHGETILSSLENVIETLEK